jgi:NitT/TauT family transport system ATP-binding protein
VIRLDISPVSEHADAVESRPRATGEVIAFRDVGKTFADGTRAVAGVSFALDAGEFLSVVGPSGCGKSTLLRIASGLERPTAGSVECSVTNVGYVFQDATLLPWRTVRGNVELLAELDGAPKREREALARDAIRLVALEGFENHYPKALSGGMRMRASLARALTTKPPLFLLDEPFGALDEITREALNDELIRLFVSERFAAIFITHSINEAVFLSTRVLVMSARPGRVVAEFEVPFAYPRSPELRFEPEFGQLASEVSHALRAGAVA